MDPEGDPRRAAERAAADVRAWFSGVPVTAGTVGLLVCWHVLAPSLAAAFGAERFGDWFVARASPSPGWLLAVLSHAGLEHLLGNLLLLVIWGSISEHVLGARRYAAFLVTTGVAGILAQVGGYIVHGVPGGIVGASGAAQATTVFAAVVLARGRGPFRTLAVRRGALAGAVSVLLLQLSSDFTGVVATVPEASGLAHLTGMVLGAAYAATDP